MGAKTLPLPTASAFPKAAVQNPITEPSSLHPNSTSACFGSDSTQFPSSNFFAAAGEGIWDDGAACGRQYLVSCISSISPRACKSGETIQIKIVDRAQTVASKPTRQGTTIVLSNAAFAAIADSNAPSLNIDFRQV
ncbi:putative EG45-like domain containing protein 1 isoform X2 [Nicotiana tomentosiformis]|uniref:putative EG45-like domain containing protein 1 isoform X2 n=1 Tax=Nicotiana tomentosiformis TaxID=4098 RepID=UPI00051C15B6|nr:putative EG45-like domain containing protein 1 isoform X2 [Nicotiana tomentosiformis]